MSTKTMVVVLGSLVLIVCLIGLGFAIVHFMTLPNRINDMETLVLGQTRYVPGSHAALRVVVRNIKDQMPITEADVSVSLEPIDGGSAITLYEGSTDSSGVANVSFHVPEDIDPSQQLIVETSSSLGEDKLERGITIDRDFKILVATDKPLYQPGQVIHLRALALSTFDLVPAAGEGIEFVIADGKGNKVFRESVETSDFGVASVDFQLASEVNTGPYKISAIMGNTSSEKTITVERYVLPKFKLTWTTDQSFYAPGEHASGVLSAEYFFGKVVAVGEVLIEGFTFDFERQDVFSIQGTTDENGEYEFDFDIPDYLIASGLDGGIGRFYLEASVTDLAEHTEQSSFSLPVAQSQIVIEAIPESGTFRPNIDNILYILTSYPDGTPAQTSLKVWVDGKYFTQETGPYGLAEINFTPLSAWQEVRIEAHDSSGAWAERYIYFEGAWQKSSVLLRPDRAVYQIGETMQLDVLSSTSSGRVYVDIIREGQTVNTRTVEITRRKGSVAVDLSADLIGTLELHAYKILPSGEIVRDTRIVVVDAPTDLTLAIETDQGEYLPGQTANVNFQVAAANGPGVQAALGLAIVDESLFALAEQDPGFAKLYFMLEAELLQPKYDIHGFSVPALLQDVPQDPTLQSALEGAAQASLASAAQSASPLSLTLNSHEEKIQAAHARQVAFFNGLTNTLFAIDILFPLAIITLSFVAIALQRALSSSLALMIGLLVGLILVYLLIPTPDWVGNQPLDKLGYLLDSLPQNEGAIQVIVLLGLLSFIALSIYALMKREWTLVIALLLTVLFIPFQVLLLISASGSDLATSESLLILVILLFLLIPLAYILRSMAFAVRRQIGWAVPAFLVGLAALFIPLAVIGITYYSGGVVALGMGMDRGPVMQVVSGGEIALIEEGEMMFDAPAAEPADVASATAGEPPRLRQYFPETMYWNPEAITDKDGQLNLEIPIADSITTWRLTALASTQDGRIGATTAGIRVFQDFFIDLDLPLALTQGDEISVPVGVFNYLPEAQNVRLVIEEASWFELLDDAEKVISIAENDINVVYFRIKANDFGRKALKVTAYGSRLSDAIQREVNVHPDGKLITYAISDRLSSEGVTQAIDIPTTAIPGTQKLVVKIYPGVVSQVVEGLDSILRMPFGCFEQTSSTTYPNVLVLDYLETTNQASPEVQFKAEEYINLGYQRLTTFEVPGGGFSLFGDPPADRMLTAYGLQEFSDMSRVHSVDSDLIKRAAEWLLDQQSSDGSWESDRGLVHENTWARLQNKHLPVTAYVVWSLIEAGYGDDARTDKGLDYIREHSSQMDDPYVVALVANALVAADRAEGRISSYTEKVLDQLAGMAQIDADKAYWTSNVATFMGSEGQTGSIETTALAAYAFLRADSHPELSNGAITFLVQQKDSFGTWYSTQATVLSLKALIETVRFGAEDVDAQVTAKLNGGETHTVYVTPETFDVVQQFNFEDINPGRQNVVTIEVEGEGDLMYQISGSYYLPWSGVASLKETLEPEMVTIEVLYDRTELKVDDTVQVDVTVTLNEPGRAEWVLIDLGIPPGFIVKTEDLNALVNRFEDVPEDYAFPTVERYELTGRQILVYIGGLSSEHPLSFSYRLQAKYPLIAQTPASIAYDYYNPDVNGEQTPIEIVVIAKE
ncbi:MAG: hypothetical protein GTO18_14175 [Anaerolineales bacterium]|nr:hypothetical protein [Anaerolineales bacterium]